ncbi:bifunctional diaminohydroxyphosphoribosylaminopyrimidine deaminase/5-amino-6-(5-phosphoribosylamino)uracil reductase RibD [Candidatus Latescibacterota bacterium]
MDIERDIYFMSRALSLAEKGRGTASPNPMVGAVVVRDGIIVGQGYHRKAGEGHAEVIALREAGEEARGATLYVTMEPCCHHGKTPPCTDAICESGIKRVVSAIKDENPVICGRGFAHLREKNIETAVGVLEDRARKLNESYLKYITRRIPFVTLKLAMTLDGRIADSRGKSKWITGPGTRKHVHLMRSWSDAVMVGVGTVLADNPSLTVRDVEGTNPLRVILDSRLDTPPDAQVAADSNVIIATTELADETRLASFKENGIEVMICDARNERVSVSSLLRKLGEREITSVLCEGGGILAATLFLERLVDKVVFTVAPKILGSGTNAFENIGVDCLDNAVVIKDKEVELIGDDIIITGYPEYK